MCVLTLKRLRWRCAHGGKIEKERQFTFARVTDRKFPAESQSTERVSAKLSVERSTGDNYR
jgi:hypothetical protein